MSTQNLADYETCYSSIFGNIHILTLSLTLVQFLDHVKDTGNAVYFCVSYKLLRVFLTAKLQKVKKSPQVILLALIPFSFITLVFSTNSPKFESLPSRLRWNLLSKKTPSSEGYEQFINHHTPNCIPNIILLVLFCHYSFLSVCLLRYQNISTRSMA